jgi:hypothetical protein
MDTGLDDGYVTPTLVPGQCEGAEPRSYPAPTLDVLDEHGFTMRLEVAPRVFEEGAIRKAAQVDRDARRIDLLKHFPIVMESIQQEAEEKGYRTLPYETPPEIAEAEPAESEATPESASAEKSSY